LAPQTPLVQLRPSTHSTQSPVRLQRLPPFCVHGVPGSLGVNTFSPFEHVSTVHSLRSSGSSVSSFTTVCAPWPSQTTFLQSLGDCSATAVFACANENPHLPASHVRVLHSSSMPGHSLGWLHAATVPPPPVVAGAVVPAPLPGAEVAPPEPVL